MFIEKKNRKGPWNYMMSKPGLNLSSQCAPLQTNLIFLHAPCHSRPYKGLYLLFLPQQSRSRHKSSFRGHSRNVAKQVNTTTLRVGLRAAVELREKNNKEAGMKQTSKHAPITLYNTLLGSPIQHWCAQPLSPYRRDSLVTNSNNLVIFHFWVPRLLIIAMVHLTTMELAVASSSRQVLYTKQ